MSEEGRVKRRSVYFAVGGAICFLAYILLAARPVPQETVLEQEWIRSLADAAENENAAAPLTAFSFGKHFGYVDPAGVFQVNRTPSGMVSYSGETWAEYGNTPSQIKVLTPRNETVCTIDNPEGYPLFLDNRIFIVGKEQDKISAVNNAGEKEWEYDFAAPLTCVAAGGGRFLGGTLIGTIELLNHNGTLESSFEPGGSRISIIAGCAISRNGQKIALISGLDKQRFIFLEKSGDTFRVSYHEELGEGFRRPVFVDFIDNDRRVVFECEDGLGVYTTALRQSHRVALPAPVYAIESEGLDDRFFVLAQNEDGKKSLLGIAYPDQIFLEAPFKSETAFIERRGERLLVGGGDKLISFVNKRR
jgi:hypothetical protein